MRPICAQMPIRFSIAWPLVVQGSRRSFLPAAFRPRSSLEMFFELLHGGCWRRARCDASARAWSAPRANWRACHRLENRRGGSSTGTGRGLEPQVGQARSSKNTCMNSSCSGETKSSSPSPSSPRLARCPPATALRGFFRSVALRTAVAGGPFACRHRHDGTPVRTVACWGWRCSSPLSIVANAAAVDGPLNGLHAPGPCSDAGERHGCRSDLFLSASRRSMI